MVCVFCAEVQGREGLRAREIRLGCAYALVISCSLSCKKVVCDTVTLMLTGEYTGINMAWGSKKMKPKRDRSMR